MTPAARARQSAGLTVEQAARKARVCPAYLRRIERQGGASWGLARRLAALYRCDPMLFLWATERPKTNSAVSPVAVQRNRYQTTDDQNEKGRACS